MTHPEEIFIFSHLTVNVIVPCSQHTILFACTDVVQLTNVLDITLRDEKEKNTAKTDVVQLTNVLDITL